MHWSTRRALYAVAKKGHDRLDADLLDALSRDESTPPAMEGLPARRQGRLVPRAGQRAEPVPEAWPAAERLVVKRS
jgi:hypothetical protein